MKRVLLSIVLILFLTSSFAQRRTPSLPTAPRPSGKITKKFNDASGADKVNKPSSGGSSNSGSTGSASSQRKSASGSFNSFQKKELEISRRLQTKQGNFTFQFESTRAEADKLGKSWVGPNHRVSNNKTTWLNQKGDKIYRRPEWKKDIGKTQANFQKGTKDPNSGKMIWESNGHLNIKK